MQRTLFLAISLISAISADTYCTTTRYWDCCKPSCSWDQSGLAYGPAKSCSKDGSKVGSNNKNICGGGGDDTVAYMCTDY